MLYVKDLSPCTQMLSVHPEIPVFRGNPVELRKMFDQTHPAGVNSVEGVKEEDITISARDGYKMRARIYSPSNLSGKESPLAVMLHVGGYVIGTLETEEINCRNFVKRLGCICVASTYRLAPENPFPVALHDAEDALKWASKHAKDIGADLSKGFIIGGQSPGANLAAVLALLARDEKLDPPLTGVFLSNPNLLSSEVVPEKYKPMYLSYDQHAEAPILPRLTQQFFAGTYHCPILGISSIQIDSFAPDNYKPDVNSFLFNPFIHPKGHAGLPPVYFQVCGMDVLRDEVLIYEKVLREEYNVKTRLDMYPGLPHLFWIAWPNFKASAKVPEDAVKGMQWLLEQTRN